MKVRVTLVAAVFLLVSVPAVVRAEGLKIGYIITQRLLIESKAGKEAGEKLKKRLAQAQGGLDKKVAEIKDLEEDIQRRLTVLSEAERRKVMEEHERQLREAKRLREDFQRELDKAEAEVMGGVNEYLREVIQDYAKDNGYDLILDANTLLYISEKADVTNGVIKAADKGR